MAECSVHDVSAWAAGGLCFQTSFQGLLNLSATSTLKYRVESIEVCVGRGIALLEGYEGVGQSVDARAADRGPTTIEDDDMGTLIPGLPADGGPTTIEDDDISTLIPGLPADRGPMTIEDDDMGTLIPGLPDEIAKSCMALVPRLDLSAMSCVAKSWEALLQSKEFHNIRKDMGTVEEWLYALTLSEDHQKTIWQVFSPLQNEWKDLPPMPGPLKCGSGFAVVDGKLLVIGGGVEDIKPVAVPDVLLYDSALNRWRKAASMHTPRYEFACAVLDGLVYVAGGHGLGGKNLPNVEVYDPQRDVWTILPSLKRARWGCIGCGLEGKLYVMAGRSSFTIGHSRCVDVYDPMKGQWEEAKNGCMMVLTHAIVDQELFCIEWKNDRKLAIFNAAENSWKRVALPLAGSLSVGFCLANLSGKVLLFPTTTEVPCDTFVYDPHASRGSEWQTAEIRPLGTCICCTTIEA